jgi:hypothetical protein
MVDASMKEYFKMGLAFTAGSVIIMIALTFFAMIFFIAGLVLVTREQKKPKEQRNNSALYGGYALMILGCILGLGLGANFLFSSLSSMDF